MIIFLYGPDSFRKLAAKRAYIEKSVKKYPAIAVEHFDCGENGDAVRFEDFAKATSLFSPVTLAVASGALSAEGKELKNTLKNLAASKTSHAILVEDSKPAKAFSFLLEKPVVAESFEFLKGAAWQRFVKEQADTLGVSLTPDTLAFLARNYEGNTWRCMTELEKLSLYGRKAISMSDVQKFHFEATVNFWEMVNGLKNPDRPRRLVALEKTFLQNEPPAKAFNILSSMWKEKAPQAAQLDFLIKSGKLDYEDALLALAVA
jgi:DNA polymerase III delta subunit